MCCCGMCTSANVHYWLGQSPEGRSSAECSFRLVGSAKEDRFKNTFSRACLQWGGLTDLAESTELHNSSESPISVLNAQGQEWRSSALHSHKGTLGHHTEGCHRHAGHQGHDHTLSLLQECFWWPGMTNQMWQSIKTCMHCFQHEGGLSKDPLHPIMATTSLDLLHVDFTSIDTTLELNKSPTVANILVFQDHFTKHILAYVNPDQTA